MSKESILFKKINLPNRIIRRRIIISIIGIVLFLLGLWFWRGIVEEWHPIAGVFFLFFIVPLMIIGSALSFIGLVLLSIQLREKRVIIRIIPVFIILLLLWEIGGALSFQQAQQLIAVFVKNSFLCKTTFFSLIYPPSIDDCYAEIAKKKENSAICGKMTVDWRRNDCYEELAIIVEDESICEEISYYPAGGHQKNDCYIEIAKKKEDLTICDKIMSDACYYELAIIKQDESVCEKMSYRPESGNRPLCYTEIAKKKEKPIICNKIIEDYYRDDCYREVAIFTGDESICEKISHDWTRSSCYEILLNKSK